MFLVWLKSTFHAITATPARVWLLVLGVYLLASFFSVTIKRYQPLPGDAAVRYKRHAHAVFSPPRVLRGEEPHFLMMAHSLGEDGDLRLSREYTASLLGGPYMGVYLRHRPAEYIFQHFSRKPDMTLVGNHPPGISILLAGWLWPLAGTVWMEPATIWVTAFVGTVGVLVFMRILQTLGLSWPVVRNCALALAFATPWFSYSRTLYTEVYIGTGFLIMLLAMLQRKWLAALPFCFLMAWFKYPALLLFGAGTLGAVAPQDGNHQFKPWINARSLRRAGLFAVAGIATFLAIFSFNKMLYADTTWFSSAPPQRASIARIGAPIAWIPGDVFRNIKRLFTDYDKGLFPHCLVLLFAIGGVVSLVRDPRHRRSAWLLLSCALPWTLVHVCYRYFMTGDSYTTRYLVPMVPLVMVGLPWFWRWSADRPAWRYAGMVALFLSALNNILAGFFPGLSFDKTPWEIWHGGWLILKATLGFASFN